MLSLAVAVVLVLFVLRACRWGFFPGKEMCARFLPKSYSVKVKISPSLVLFDLRVPLLSVNKVLSLVFYYQSACLVLG